VESLSSNAGKGVFKHPVNSTAFFYFMEVDMEENQKRQLYSAREIEEIRRADSEHHPDCDRRLRQ